MGFVYYQSRIQVTMVVPNGKHKAVWCPSSMVTQQDVVVSPCLSCQGQCKHVSKGMSPVLSMLPIASVGC